MHFKISLFFFFLVFLNGCNDGNSYANPEESTLDITPPTLTVPDDLSLEATGITTLVSLGNATANDNIDGSIPLINDAPTRFPLGTTSVTYSATDLVGNTATATQNVTITDTTAPTISPPPNNISMEATNVATTVPLGIANATDLVDDNITVTNDAPTTFSIGTTTVTYSATDNAGNTATTVQQVVLLDTTPPLITAPVAILATSFDNNPITLAIGSATATDIFPVTITHNAPFLWLFPVGTTLVTWQATDTNGNSATATQTIIVTYTDTTPPAITPPLNLTLEATGITTNVTLGSATAIDNIDGHISPSNNAPTAFPLGITTVTYSATDVAGNTAIATQSVTITDTTAPIISPLPNLTQEATGSTTTVTLGAATASDLVDGAISVSNNAPITFPIGTTTVIYTATDAIGNTATATQSITITDTTTPIISPPPDLTLEATGSTTTVTLGAATASDLVNGTVSVSNDAPTAFPVGTTTVTYSATDVVGNIATATQSVTITDTTAPIISPLPDLTLEATGSTTAVTLGAATASDLVDGAISVSNDALTTFPVGIAVVTYTATDIAGNTATATQTVTITDTTAPIISPPPDLTLEATGSTTTVALGTATANDLVDGVVSVQNDAPIGFFLGATTVTYSATDVAGNTATTTQTITVIDTTPPVITVPADANLNSNDGSPVAGSIGVATATDLVDGNVTVTNNAPALFPIGVTTVTYTASDSLGHTATATQTVTVAYSQAPVIAAVPIFTITAVKSFQFDWNDVPDATFYRLLENPDGISGFTQLGADIFPSIQTITKIVTLYRRLNAQYILQSCNPIGCTDSSTLNVTGTLINAIGRLTHSNRGAGDRFGWSVHLSADTNTLAVGSSGEDNNASGINPSGNNNSALQSGAVHIFTRNETTWTQQAFIKASNAEAGDEFGHSVSLADDGNTLIVSAHLEDSNATGINGSQIDNTATDSGAVYVFTRSGTTWSQQAYIKASNTDIDDEFGSFVELSSDGNTLAIAAINEDSNATDINGDELNNSTNNAGATYIFTRNGSVWTQQAYIKASNTGSSDLFGQSLSLSVSGNILAVSAHREDTSGTNTGAVYTFSRNSNTWSPQSFIKHLAPFRAYESFGQSISLSGDGTVLAIGSPGNDSGATGINGDSTDTSANASGSAYIFTFNGSSWLQETFIKASNTETSDSFGDFVTLSSDGNTLAVSATKEDSNATGLNGNEADNSTGNSGAVYVFKRITGSWEQQAYIKNIVIDNNAYFGVSTHLSPNGDTLSIGARGESGGGAVYLY